jgi:hypothetical protein
MDMRRVRFGRYLLLAVVGLLTVGAFGLTAGGVGAAGGYVTVVVHTNGHTWKLGRWDTITTLDTASCGYASSITGPSITKYVSTCRDGEQTAELERTTNATKQQSLATWLRYSLSHTSATFSAVLTAHDASGTVVGRWKLTGAEIRQWTVAEQTVNGTPQQIETLALDYAKIVRVI